jgi:hypothetical protein
MGIQHAYEKQSQIKRDVRKEKKRNAKKAEENNALLPLLP